MLARIRLRTSISLVLALAVALLAISLFGTTPAQAQQGAFPVKPANQAVLDKLAQLTGGTKLETLPPTEARLAPTFADATRGVLADSGQSTAPEPVDSVVDTTIPAELGEIPVRVYTPAGTSGGAPLPVIVYYHGGGWTIGSYDVYDSSGRALANAANAIVVSVNYRLGPENPFPAAANDAYAAYAYATENAGVFGGDPTRVAVAGESAGGNLAAATAIKARDTGIQMPTHQLLVYPITNYNFDTESYGIYANAMPLSKPLMQYFWANYLTTDADSLNPYASPLQAEDLSGLPPATVVGARIDPLQTEGQQYADALAAAGVPVRYQIYEGVTHEFFGAGAVIPEANDAVAFAASGLTESFGTTQATSSALPDTGGASSLAPLAAALGLLTVAVSVAFALRSGTTER